MLSFVSIKKRHSGAFLFCFFKFMIIILFDIFGKICYYINVMRCRASYKNIKNKRRNKMSDTIKKITLTGMGIALFVVLSLCLQVPIFQNYYLCLGYIAMIVYLYTMGTTYGTIVGVFGTILYCILINGLRGMPGWALGNIAIGIIIGLWFKITKDKTKNIVYFALSSVIIIIAVLTGILGVKSVTEMILYSQPLLVRIAKNIYAFIADVVVLIVALPICKVLDPQLRKIVYKV